MSGFRLGKGGGGHIIPGPTGYVFGAYIDEYITVDPANAFTDSVLNLIPANVWSWVVAYIVTSPIGGGINLNIGTPSVVDMFGNTVPATLNSAGNSWTQTMPTTPFLQGPVGSKIRITPSGVGTAVVGEVHVVSYYISLVNPTA